MKEIYDQVSAKCSKITTNKYSTSFSLGIRFLNKDFREPIYSLYGFVRLADEIVDSFHGYDKETLLAKFRDDTYDALEKKISLNPILNSFQKVVHQYAIDPELIEAFLISMKMDLHKSEYQTEEELQAYVLGSAEVVGLMCLRVFCNGDNEQYESLKFEARQLGSAFQKINFLRDLRADCMDLGRNYFPELNVQNFDEVTKRQIEEVIQQEFHHGYQGIKKLPHNSRFGVYVAYVYYYSLFKKLQNTPSAQVLKRRIRIPNPQKYALFLSSYLKHSLKLI